MSATTAAAPRTLPPAQQKQQTAQPVTAPASMSPACLILGESGTGKTTSLRNMDPAQTLLIQVVRKPLPFKVAGWKTFDGKEGNIYQSDNPDRIIQAMRSTKRPVVVIDDFQYVLSNEYMRRTKETGYQKFTDIGKNAWEIFNASTSLRSDQRCYILAHTAVDEEGRSKLKTVGKFIDEKITPEGLFSIVLSTHVQDGRYFFATQNSGQDTTKSPMGMFTTPLIDNDLAAVDRAIVEYYKDSI